MSFQEIRHAARVLSRAPLFTATAVFMLAKGIGTTVAIFTLVDVVLLRPLPFPQAEELVAAWERSDRTDKGLVSPLDYLDWKEQNSTFQVVAAAATPAQIPLADETGRPPEIITLQNVTGAFFDVLGVTPVAGRTFSAQDESAGAGMGVVMSERLWRAAYGADAGIVGRTIRVGSPPRTVAVMGVVPARFQVFGTVDLWDHLPMTRADVARGQGLLRVVGRLQPGRTIEQARADLTLVARNIERIAPATNTGKSVTVESLRDAVMGDDLRTTSLLLGGVVLSVLLLACANVANLMLSRGVGRTREIAVRLALGGAQWRIAKQLLTENVLLGALGGAAGLAVAWALLRAARVLIPPHTLPEPIALSIDWRVGAFAAGLTLFTSLLFGVAPAWQTARVRLAEAMNTGGRGASDGPGRVRRGVVILEVAAALLLLTGAGLLVRTLVSLDRVAPGYRANDVVTMGLRLPFRSLVRARPGELGTYWQSIGNEVADVPGVRVAAFGSNVPLDGVSTAQAMPFEIVGEPIGDPASRPVAQVQIISPRYFEALGIPVTRGRAFTESDAHEAAPVAIVNEEFVRRYVVGQDPIGARVTIQNPLMFKSTPVTREIVGVVPSVRSRPDEPDHDAVQVFAPLAQNNWLSPMLFVRTAEAPARIVPAIKAAIARVDSTQAVASVRTMQAVAADATARPRFRAQMVAAFAVAAMALAAVGIFGVMTFAVQQRAREFSIRVAVGASRRDLLRLVFGSAFRLTAAGIVVGLLVSAVLARTLERLLFGVQPLDPMTFVAAPVLLIAVALLACAAPAVRALRVDPVAALRAD